MCNHWFYLRDVIYPTLVIESRLIVDSEPLGVCLILVMFGSQHSSKFNQHPTLNVGTPEFSVNAHINDDHSADAKTS